MLHSTTLLRKYRLAASDGGIGHVSDIYFDSHEWTVRFLVANTGSWLLGKEVLIPARALGHINMDEKSVCLDLTLEKIRGAPDIDTARPVSRQEDIATHNYYGYSKPHSVSVGVTFALSREVAAVDNPWRPEQPAVGTERGDFHLRSAHDVIGHAIHASDDEMGHVGDFLVDDSDWSIRYFIVNTSLWLGSAVVVPTALIREVSWNERSVYLTIPSERVKYAPEYNADGPQIEGLEQRLAEYYDLKMEAPKG